MRCIKQLSRYGLGQPGLKDPAWAQGLDQMTFHLNHSVKVKYHRTSTTYYPFKVQNITVNVH